MPDGVERIGNGAFGQTNLREIVLPYSVHTLDDFSITTRIEKITIPNPDVTFGQAVFVGSDTTTLYAPAGSTAEAYAPSQGLSFSPIEEE